MNIALWVLQGLLAFHTVSGGVWKFTNSVEAVPSLKALPHQVWLTLGALELLVGLAFVVPALHGSLAILAPIAAVCIAVEMLMFSGVHFSSGDKNHGLVVYWLAVAAICAFVAYGRFVLVPL